MNVEEVGINVEGEVDNVIGEVFVDGFVDVLTGLLVNIVVVDNGVDFEAAEDEMGPLVNTDVKATVVWFVTVVASLVKLDDTDIVVGFVAVEALLV